MHALAQEQDSQFIIATHSPIIMAYPYAKIMYLNTEGLQEVDYEETEHYRITRDFFIRRIAIFKELFTDT
jgi:predicted ATPase